MNKKELWNYYMFITFTIILFPCFYFALTLSHSILRFLIFTLISIVFSTVISITLSYFIVEIYFKIKELSE